MHYDAPDASAVEEPNVNGFRAASLLLLAAISIALGLWASYTIRTGHSDPIPPTSNMTQESRP